MAKSQFRSKRKVSGTKYIAFRKKRACDMGGVPALTHIGEQRLKIKRAKGANVKKSLFATDKVMIQEGKKTVSLKIISVVNNPANINFTRRNIITKGAIVKTDKGNVRITSRPGQTGTLFGVLVN